MSKPTGYIVRPKDMKALTRELTRQRTSWGDVWDAAKTLAAWAEPQQTQLPPVSVVSLAPSYPDGPPVLWDPADRLAMHAALHIHSAGGRCIKARSGRRCSSSPEADALDRIADVWGSARGDSDCLREIAQILRGTGRL